MTLNTVEDNPILNCNFFKLFVNLANQILYSKIKLSSDSFIVLNIFGKILEGKTTTFRKNLIGQIKDQQGLHPDFMKYLVDSIKINQILLV